MSNSRSLKNRLGYLRESRGDGPQKRKTGQSSPELSLPGWQKRSEFLWERTVKNAGCVFPAVSSGYMIPGDRGRIRFFDFETTGLSGGAGTIIFLAGIGYVEEDGLSVRQLFLSDFPGEREFLETLIQEFPEDSILVSYNGKSFDAGLLKTRCLLQRMSLVMPGDHLDLLYPARSLFRRITGSCSLGVIEEEILHIARSGDIPGMEIPGEYFSFLKTGNVGRLPDVFYHNLQDIVSLAGLLIHMEALFDDPLSSGRVDLAGLGRLLLEKGDPNADACLRHALDGGDVKAGRILGFHLKGLGRFREADEIWQVLAWRDNDIIAAEERAKYLEHRIKDPAAALEFLKKALRDLKDVPGDRLPQIEHRINRLEKKSAIRRNGDR